MEKTIRDLVSKLEHKGNMEKTGFTKLSGGTNFNTGPTNAADCLNSTHCAPTNQQTNCGGGNLINCAN